MGTRVGKLACAILLLMMVPVPAGAQPAKSSNVHVSLKEFAFSPATVHVPAGSSITWTYDESVTDPAPNCETAIFQLPLPVSCPGHSVTSAPTAGGKPLFDSGVHRASGYPYTFRFANPGTYNYYCIVHGGPHPNNPVTHMNGVVIVDASAAVVANTNTSTAVGGAGTGVAGGGSARGTGVLAATGPSGPMHWGWPLAAVAAGLSMGLATLKRRATSARLEI